MEKVNSANNYRVLSWYGSASGVDLTAQFDIGQIRHKTLIIKRIAFFTYCNDALIIQTWYDNDNSNVFNKAIAPASRVANINGLEIYGEGLKPIIKINDIPLALFPLRTDNTFFGYPIDLDIDNINVKFDSPVNTISVSAEYEIYNQAINQYPPTDNDKMNPKVKVIMEVYLT